MTAHRSKSHACKRSPQSTVRSCVKKAQPTASEKHLENATGQGRGSRLNHIILQIYPVDWRMIRAPAPDQPPELRDLRRHRHCCNARSPSFVGSCNGNRAQESEILSWDVALRCGRFCSHVDLRSCSSTSRSFAASSKVPVRITIPIAF